MLVLTLRPGDCLRIGETTTIHVLNTGRKSLRVRLGLDAPKSRKIVRGHTATAPKEERPTPPPAV